MPVSEKDIFTSLMQDPNHAYNPIEKVWAEAQQRARQFRNNEKALALAFDNAPALEKLFEFIYKADDDNASKEVPSPTSISLFAQRVGPTETDDSFRERTEDTKRTFDDFVTRIGTHVRSFEKASTPNQYSSDDSYVFPNEGWKELIIQPDGTPRSHSEDEAMTGTMPWDVGDDSSHIFSRGGTPNDNIFTMGNKIAKLYAQLRIIKAARDKANTPADFEDELSNIVNIFMSRANEINPTANMTQVRDNAKKVMHSLFEGGLFEEAYSFNTNIVQNVNAWLNNKTVQEYHNAKVGERGGDEGEEEALPLSPSEREQPALSSGGDVSPSRYAEAIGSGERSFAPEAAGDADAPADEETPESLTEELLREFNNQQKASPMSDHDLLSPGDAKDQKRDKIYLSAPSQKLAEEKKLIEFEAPEDIGKGNWKWTSTGTDYILPILEALHKPYPKETRGTQTPNHGTIRSATFENIVNRLENETLPTPNFFTPAIINAEQGRLENAKAEYSTPAPARRRSSGTGGRTSQRQPRRTPELPYEGDRSEYSKFIPAATYEKGTRRGGQEPQVRVRKLVPTIRGQEYKPFEFTGDDSLNNRADEDANIKKAIALLAEEYATIHEGGEGTPHLGFTDHYFPGDGSTAQNWIFNTHDFTDDQKLKYNELNANKAIIEEYLRVLSSAKALHMTSEGEPDVRPWTAQLSEEQQGGQNNSWQGVMNDALTYKRMDQIPHVGAWDWYQLLTDFHGLTRISDSDIKGYQDINENPSFHLLPAKGKDDKGKPLTHFENLGYKPQTAYLSAFQQQIIEDAKAEDATGEEQEAGEGLANSTFYKNVLDSARFLIDARQAAYPDVFKGFKTHLTAEEAEQGGRNHFNEAWKEFSEGKKNESIHPAEDFLNWLGMNNADATGVDWKTIVDKSDWVANIQPQEPPRIVSTGGGTGDGGFAGDSTNEGGSVGDSTNDGVPDPLTPEEQSWVQEQPEYANIDSSLLSNEDINRIREGYKTFLIEAQVVADKKAEEERLLKVRQERDEARETKVNYIIETMQLNQKLTDDDIAREKTYLLDLKDDKFESEHENTMKLHRKIREYEYKKEEKAAQDAEKEAAKPPGKTEHTPEEFAKLKEDFKRVYEKVFGPLSNDFFDSFSTDYETLDKEYKKALQVQHNNANKEAQGLRQTNANNITGPNGIDPLPDAPTQDDLLHQVRQIQNWKYQHGPHITDKAAKDTLHQLEIEAYQKANNAGIDLEEFIKKDQADAKEQKLDYGSSAWLKAVGKTHLDDQMKKARYRRQVQQGGELRANTNYKPWLVIQYDKDGTGKLFDLRSQQEVRKEDLKFDKENMGFDYSGSETSPEFTDPESAFWDNLDYANLQPIRTDEDGRRSATQPPQIGHSPRRFGQGGTRHAWYHPESQSWINPHRYQDAMDELGTAAPGSGMLLLHGSNYHGTNQSGDRGEQYGFQATGTGKPHSYYLDGQGNIAYVNTDYEHGKVSPDYSQPQTVNSVIHDWHSDHMQQQIKADQASFLAGPNQLKDSVILSPQQQQGPMPLQNAVQEGDALYRRRLQGQRYGKRGFDKLSSDELGMEPTYYGKRGRMQRLTPRVGTEKLKQGFVGAVEYTESGILTGLAKLALNTVNIGTLGILGLGWGQEQKNIRRQRANYNRQAKIEQGVQDHMLSVTDNGRQRQYLSPGEEKARIEDHKALKDSLSSIQARWQNKMREHRAVGNKAEGDRAEANHIKFQALRQSIDKRQIENPADWKHINTLYEKHYGSPQVQDTLAPAIGEQPSRNLADIFQPQRQPQAESQPEIETNWESSPSQRKEIKPNWESVPPQHKEITPNWS